METNGNTEGYSTLDGRWFRNSQEEMESRKDAVKFNQEVVDSYNMVGKPAKYALAYLGLRGLGQLMGIGPEFDANEPFLGDIIGFGLTVFPGISKGCGYLIKMTDLKSAKREYAEAQERLGIVNGL